RRRRRRRRRRQRPKTTASFCPRSAPLRARGGGPRAPEPAGCWGRAGRRLEGQKEGEGPRWRWWRLHLCLVLRIKTQATS
ncbi:unnamed protein product, partial [Prorocentrum cordatum]